MGRKSLGGPAGRSRCGASWSCGRYRTAVGRKPLVALPRPLSAPASLPRTRAAARKSFRPTASRTRGTNTETQKQNQTQIPCACRSPLEKTMEADISILRKTGHFYFALTALYFANPLDSGLHCCSACVVFAKGARHGRRPYIETDNGEMNSPLQETRSPLRTGTGVPCPYKRKKARASGGGPRRRARARAGLP